MATISSMLSGTYLMYKNYYNSSASSKSNAVTSLWKNYNPSRTTSSAASTLSGLLGIRSNVSELISTYNSTKKTFDSEFSETIDALKKSTATVKNLNYKVGADALTVTETIGEDGTTSTTSKMSDELADIVNGVKNFADDYNGAIKFFTDNSSVSKQVKYLASNFSDTIYNKSAKLIGINISSDGKMTVDEEALAKSVTENPTRVDAIMSTLTNKAERHMSFANSQQSRLFPSMNSMLGSSLKSESVYSGNSLLRLSNYSAAGSLLNYLV